MLNLLEKLFFSLYYIMGLSMVTVKPSKTYKIYKLLFIIGVTALAVYCFTGKWKYIYPHLNKTSAILEISVIIIMVIQIVLNIILTDFIYDEQVAQIAKKITKIEAFLKMNDSSKLIQNHHFRFSFTNLLLLFVFIFDYYANIELYKVENSIYNIIISVTVYNIALFILQITILANLIENYFKKLNSNFNQFIGKQWCQKTDIPALISIVKCHKYISEIVFIINKVFGNQLLILDKIFTIFLVETTHMGLVFDKGKSNSWIFVVFYVMWTLVFLVNKKPISKN